MVVLRWDVPLFESIAESWFALQNKTTGACCVYRQMGLTLENVDFNLQPFGGALLYVVIFKYRLL
jgi:hypothetical protein